MNKIKLIFKIMLSIPKTIYFNFRVFEIKTAIKFPVFISNNVKIKGIYKKCIDIKCDKLSFFMIKIGILGSEAINSTNRINFS